MDDRTYSSDTCFALDINRRNFAFAKAASSTHPVYAFAFYLHRLMVASWTDRSTVSNQVAADAFGRRRLLVTSQPDPDIHPHIFTVCVGGVQPTTTSHATCTHGGVPAAWQCEA